MDLFTEVEKVSTIRITLVLVLIITLGTSSCRKINNNYEHQKPNKINEIKEYYKQSDFSIATNIAPSNELSIRYIGCGGLLINNKGEGIIIDPFYSNPNIKNVFTATILPKRKIISPNTKLIDNKIYPYRDEFRLVKAILVTHGHYDHFLDVPYLFMKYKNDYENIIPPKIYCGTTAKNLVRNIIDPAENLIDLEPKLATCCKNGEWSYVSGSDSSIRFIPFLSEHAPHTNQIKFFPGDTCKPIARTSTYLEGTKVWDWPEGKTFSFLVDIMKDGKPDYRIFIQTSASNYPIGLPPEFLCEKQVDLAIICVASYHTVKNYPAGILKKLMPKNVLLVHWEDFFRSYNRPPKTVFFTNIAKFGTALDSVNTRLGNPFNFYMPAPGVKVTIRANSK
jgi:L-ascorbate metabolism protein UlaG (beta-lactamase superfamily)